MNRKAVVTTVFTVCFGVAAPRVFAHAFLDHATPAVGATVEAPPPSLELRFTEDVEVSFSSVDVLERSSQKRIDVRPIEQPRPDTLVVPLPPLSPGEYEVHWKVVSVDTHPTEGTFKFRVSPR